jgi:hypothetical protein
MVEDGVSLRGERAQDVGRRRREAEEFEGMYNKTSDGHRV